MKKYIKIILLITIIFIGTFLITTFLNIKKYSINNQENTSQGNLPSMTLDELSKYNGEDQSKPIYIGFNGLVYDVTSGISFYKKGAVYNYLTGKDSSAQLNIIGGDIIVKKYKAVATIIK